MITEEEARLVAGGVLREFEEKLERPLAIFDGEFGVSGIVDHGDAWVVNWNSVKYLRSGDFLDQVLVGPIAVPKGGEDFWVMGAARSVEEQLMQWRAERRSHVRIYREYSPGLDGGGRYGAVYRRERGDDATGDSVFRIDGKWHFTSEISMSLKGYSDIELGEVSESEAREALEQGFGAADELYAPMVVDSDGKSKK
jgi:hypothetical protein